MSHPFGDKIRQHITRKHGLSQAKLAEGIHQKPSVITLMCQGERLNGQQSRERVIDIIKWFYDQEVLSTRIEADALLEAAGMARLGSIHPVKDEEQQLNHMLKDDTLVQPSLDSAVSPLSNNPQRVIPPSVRPTSMIFGSAPRLPRLFIGRDDDVRDLKQRLNIDQPGSIQALTAMRGWPGVGKTTIAAVLAHDQEIAQSFPDGVLWASLGQQPSVFAELTTWGRALGVPMADVRSIKDASGRLAAFLSDKQMLLIVDDVWQVEHVEAFRIGGKRCAMLFTTRLPEVARKIALPQDVYILGVLSDESGLELLRTLAPDVVAQNLEASKALVTDLEALPLALHVAGRLLHIEASLGFGVEQLLAEIREGARLIEAQAPADRAEISNETTPTIAALLNKSTDLLDADMLDYFAYLGAFAPKPATFDATAMQSVWQVDDPKPAIRTLVDHGLLEPHSEQRFWMHALLVMHACSFLND